MYLLEAEYLAEVLDPDSDTPVPAGRVRRTGADEPRPRRQPADPLPHRRPGAGRTDAGPCGRTWRRLDGGILGRADDMIHVRGQQPVPGRDRGDRPPVPGGRRVPIVVDHTRPAGRPAARGRAGRGATATLAEAVGRAVRDELLFRVEVTAVPPGTLPRFEMKARRVVHRHDSPQRHSGRQ